ncbi:MAG: GSU2403 family nucleotidyltransferase fold protein [Rhodobacteraceae bacterium]|nr:GSU2403 family nucleotidyltransferase fold protein [Paracoccaceae bacterium]
MAMNPLERMPVSGQTLFADLADMAWTGIFREVMASAGTLYNCAIARANTATTDIGSPYRGRNPALGKASRSGSPNARQRIRDRTELVADRKDRLEIVRVLRAARLQVPDGLNGKVLAVLSEAGAFRLRALVVGSVALRCNEPMLGVRVPGEPVCTGDVDIGEFTSISLAVNDGGDADLVEVLQGGPPVRGHSIAD